MAPDNRCLLFSLPDELLEEICHLAALSEIEDSYKTRHSMVLVSKRMNRVATPILHRYLGVYWWFPAPWKPKPGMDALASKFCLPCLHEKITPEDMARIGQDCRSLQLYMGRPLPDYQANKIISLVLILLTCFSGVRSLTIGGYIGEMALLTVFDTAINNMPRLQKITHMTSGQTMLPPWVFFSRYRLSVSALRLDALDESQLKPGGSCTLKKVGGASLPTIKSLRIGRYRGDVTWLEMLVRELSGLEHLKVSHFDCDSIPLDLSSFSYALSLHMATLRSLYIGQCSVTGMLDLSGFDQLEALHLHYTSFSKYAFNDAIGRRLLAPRLKFLGIDFTRDWRWEWAPLDVSAETWLKGLGAYAVRVKSPLTKLFLGYKPYSEKEYRYTDAWMLGGYPWDRLIHLKTYFRDLGIWLAYSRTKYSTGRWLSSGSSLSDIDFYMDFIFNEY